MSYPDQALNLETDARTNTPVPSVDFAVRNSSDLAKLRAMWAEMPSTPKLLATRDLGEDNSWPGFNVRTLLRGEESSGRWSFNSLVVAPGAELPAHSHDVGDTYWFVVEGEVEITVGAVTTKLVGPSFAFAPNQTTQALANRSSRPAEVFVGYAPAGADRAFAAAHRLWKERPDASAESYQAVFALHGFQFTGGKPLPNDARTNQAAERVDEEIRRFDDYLNLRKRWRSCPLPRRL
jgi:quercetin dioxygenase-like cupin family protein